MKEQKLFDLFCHMSDEDTMGTPYKIISGGKELSLSPRKQTKVLNKSIQAFMHMVAGGSVDRPIQAFMGSADLPQLTKDVFNVFNQTPEFDMLWQESFRGIKLNKGQLEWEIADITSASTFELIPEGGKVKFHEFTGSKVSVGIQKYGMGLGITWETIEGRKLYKFIEQLNDVRAKLFTLWANIHYGLLATAAATNALAWQGAVGESTLQRDIQTINFGYETIGEATKDSGYGDTANAPMLVYASPKLKSRIMQALRATSTDVIRTTTAAASPGRIVEYNVKPLFTWNSNIPANKVVMVLPGNKVQNSVYLRELGLSKQDMESLNELRSYWTAFGAVVGDNDQTAELAFA